MRLPAMWLQPPVAGNPRAPRPSRWSACAWILRLSLLPRPRPSPAQRTSGYREGALGGDAQARRKPPLFPAHQLASSLEGEATCIGSAWRAKACAEAHLRLRSVLEGQGQAVEILDKPRNFLLRELAFNALIDGGECCARGSQSRVSALAQAQMPCAGVVLAAHALKQPKLHKTQDHRRDGRLVKVKGDRDVALCDAVACRNDGQHRRLRCCNRRRGRHNSVGSLLHRMRGNLQPVVESQLRRIHADLPVALAGSPGMDYTSPMKYYLGAA